MKSHHYTLLATTFIVVAAVTAIVVYFSSIKVFIKDKVSGLDVNTQIDNQQEIKVDFVKVDPEAPIALPSGTIGGVTACERLDNLKACLKSKNIGLFEKINSEIATSGATIEEKCSSVLSNTNSLRMESIKSGCIF